MEFMDTSRGGMLNILLGNSCKSIYISIITVAKIHIL